MRPGRVVVRFTTKGHIGSRIAAKLSQSREFNHCMLIDGDMVSEAVTWGGTRYLKTDIAMRGVKKFQDMVVFVPDIEAMRAFLCDQYGKGYDWLGAIGLPILRSEAWQDDDRWWCSELILAALGAGGNWILDPGELRRVTPNDLRQVQIAKLPYNQPASAGFFTANP